MKKMIVNKDLLSNYKALVIALENCDVYEVNAEDILDVYCAAKPINRKNSYRTYDGFIKIAARASKTARYSGLCSVTDADYDHCLKNRLQQCGGCADMTSFSLRDKKNHDMDIYVPYNSLLDVTHGNEIELSNCPSLEIDNDGNMIIAFGKSSKQPKRKDNNYSELIEGWKAAFGDFKPKILKARVEHASTFGDEQTNLLLSFGICNKNSKKDFAELVFMDCKNIDVETFSRKNENCRIFMSRMADGRIYVGFEGLWTDFICASVLEYGYYCNRD